MSAGEKLTEKQRRFVEAFMGQAAGNATEAARLAGYSGSQNTLRVIASENLTKPAVKAAIESRAKPETATAIATREELQQLWSDVAFGRGDHAGVEMKDRLKASELLCRTRGHFVDKVEHSGKLDVSGLSNEQLVAEISKVVVSDPEAAEIFALAQKQERPS